MRITNQTASPKSKVELDLSDLDNIEVGDVLFRATPNPPDGFLRCNGSVVSKTTYADLYSVIGEGFNTTNIPGNGKPYNQQYGINDQPNLITGTWSSGTSLSASNAYFSLAVTKNKVYIFGRFNGSSYTDNIYTADISASGVISGWTHAGMIPNATFYSNILIVNNYLYVFGGYDGTYRNTIYRTQVLDNGSFTNWTTDVPLPFTLAHSQMLVVKNRFYLIGGTQNGTVSGDVYSSLIHSDGSLGNWIKETSLPYTIKNHSVVYLKNKIYVLGGIANGTATSIVQSGNVLPDGSIFNWQVVNNLPSTVTDAAVAVTNHHVYLIGGLVNGSASTQVIAAEINVDESLSDWNLISNIPSSRYGHEVILTSTRMYILGGYSGSTVKTTVNYIDINGGIDDASPYYSVQNPSLPGNNFTLPDYSDLESYKLYSFIKF